MYRSNSFNCNKEPEGCGNCRFIIAKENMTNSHKPVYLPLFDKCVQGLLGMILNLYLRFSITYDMTGNKLEDKKEQEVH
jgi:hypothetical protein